MGSGANDLLCRRLNLLGYVLLRSQLEESRMHVGDFDLRRGIDRIAAFAY